MKFGRVGSPAAVCGEVWNTTSFEGSATRLALTAMRPANPTVCVPGRADRAGICGTAVEEERQFGRSAGQRGDRGVADTASTSTLFAPPSSSTRNVVPDGLEN